MGDVHGNTEEPTSPSLALLQSDALGTTAWPPSYTLHDRMALPTVATEICDLALISKDSEDLHIQFSQEGRNKQGSTPSFIRALLKEANPSEEIDQQFCFPRGTHTSKSANGKCSQHHQSLHSTPLQSWCPSCRYFKTCLRVGSTCLKSSWT